ncbi:NADP-dependent oxidoreductase [Lacticaseibacillus songhuajiangensis]|jgi:NADPH:quinone reductase-like Zn-dependent oxidoreductase|uniref:NADP-dependent oxidoreductase n=1 Tax=Lacticaseibacillus songhuajiangensis TaxID=1296539 RepID=UPI000F786035|nr:NADP-dependent oxidoreductase [Lacticaseibacillus songhuajiangensis]MCI1284071.1 NADP-dependent oxidoreductase [Lacticaseibacillus songhuajiangensis]
MIRFGFNEYGGPEVFRAIEAEIPEPKPQQVQIKVLAFGLNAYDIKVRQGKLPHADQAKMPIVPGTELAGIVTAVGAEVTDIKVGDHVMNYRPRGGYSEYVTASASKVGVIANDVPLTIAAGFPQIGVAAYAAAKLLNLKAGKTIAVEGASGGVGSIVVQIAKYYGLQVIALGNSRNHDLMMRLGADFVGHYDHENVGAKFADQADYVLNATTSGKDDDAGLWMLKPGGTYVSLNDLPEAQASDPNFHVVGEAGKPDVAAAFAFLNEMRSKADLWLNVADVFPMTLAGVREAQVELGTHHAAGKIICSREENQRVRKD